MKKLLVGLICLATIALPTIAYAFMLDKVGMLSMEYDLGLQSDSAWLLGLYAGKKQLDIPTEVGLVIAGGGAGDKVLGEIAGCFKAEISNFEAGIEAGMVVYPEFGFVGKALFGFEWEYDEYKYLYLTGIKAEVKTGLAVRYVGKWHLGIPIVIRIGILFW